MATLDYSDIKKRIQNSGDDVIEELYSFGEKLVSDAVDRLAKSDNKAAAIAAYCGGLVTLALSTSPIWGKYLSLYSSIFVVTALLCLIVAAWMALGSTHPQQTEWYSDNDWFRTECLADLAQLRRYRVLTMWRVVASHQAIFREKMRHIRIGVVLLKIASALLLAALLEIAWRFAPLQHLRVWIR